MNDDKDAVKDFVAESRESLDLIDREVVALKKHPDKPGPLATILRSIRTIKAPCGVLGFTKLESIHFADSLYWQRKEGHSEAASDEYQHRQWRAKEIQSELAQLESSSESVGQRLTLTTGCDHTAIRHPS
jgi:chemotaxis protein histidine kinase CheA